MPGFGSGAFGSESFGAYDWALQVLYKDLPYIDRRLDQDEAGGVLKTWTEALSPIFEEVLLFTRDFEQLRDPDSIRTQFQDRISVTITGSVVEVDKRTVRVTVLDTDPSDPLVPLGRTSVGWVLKDSTGREFTVNQVHKLSNAVIVTGNVLPAAGAATLRPPALIGFLGSDYGITVDQHDPEVFQRSSVRNAFQWLSLKGRQRAYEVIGKIAGYDVVAVPLWALGSSVPSSIPAGHYWEMPLGSGVYYTDLAPAMARFDEVAADIIPTDVFCWEEDPISGDTYGEVIGATMQGLAIVSTTSLGGGLWRVRVTGDLTPIASAGYIDDVSVSPWYATFPGGGAGQFWLESDPVDLGGGDWTFEVVAGTAPVFGATVNLDYECRPQPQCWFCRASAIRVEMVPDEVLLEPDALFDNALERMVTKILQVVPIHVRLTDLVHIVGPVTAAVWVSTTPGPGHIYATVVSQTRAVFVSASVGYYFDIVEGDEVETDPDHLVAWKV